MSQTVERRQLLFAELNGWSVNAVDVREIRLEPGQHAGRHLHPCTVVGYIIDGVAIFQVEGEMEQTLPAGSAFYESVNKVIANFGNASNTEPMTFVAFYLKNGDEELIRMLQS